MQRNRRAHRRWPCRLRAHFGRKSPKYLGFVVDVSRKGMALRVRDVFGPGTPLVVDVEAGEPVRVGGTVRWTRQIQAESTSGLLHEMGLELDADAPAQLLKSVRASFVEKRVHPRYRDTIKVVFIDPGNVAEAFTRDLSEGGLFIKTGGEFRKGDRIKVRLVLPRGLDQVALSGEVVNVFKPGNKTGDAAGIGVRLLDVQDGDEKIVMDYLSELRELYAMLGWEG